MEHEEFIAAQVLIKKFIGLCGPREYFSTVRLYPLRLQRSHLNKSKHLCCK